MHQTIARSYCRFGISSPLMILYAATVRSRYSSSQAVNHDKRPRSPYHIFWTFASDSVDMVSLMNMAAFGNAFVKAFKRLETLAGTAFKSKTAADEALKAVKSDISKTLTRESGTHAGTTDRLMESMLSRASARTGGTAENSLFRVAIDAADGADAGAAVTLETLLRDMRRGRVTRVLDGLDVPVDSAFRRADFVECLTRTLRDTYPDAAVEAALRRPRDAPGVPAELFEKTAYETADDLRALIERHAAAQRLVKAVEKSLRKGRPIVSRGLFFGITLTTGGAAAIYTALAEGAKRAAGCWRVYRDKDTGELVSCRVRYACCEIAGNDGGLPEDRYCRHYPSVVRETSCAEEWSGETPCVRCDPSGTGTDRLKVEDYVDPNDVYVCLNRPSLGEMLGQVVLDAPHVLGEAANDVVEGAESVFGRLWNEALRVGAWIIVGLALSVALLYFWERRSKDDHDDDNDNDGRDERVTRNAHEQQRDKRETDVAINPTTPPRRRVEGVVDSTVVVANG